MWHRHMQPGSSVRHLPTVPLATLLPTTHQHPPPPSPALTSSTPGYQVTLTGHSLGIGANSLLAALPITIPCSPSPNPPTQHTHTPPPPQATK